jgi:glucosamine--fructose-6-phosphate aminotransferase (isomerizing)
LTWLNQGDHFGVCNVVGSSIPRATQREPTAGPVGVPAPRHSRHLIVLNMIALIVAQKKETITEQKFHELTVEMENIPSK